MKTRIGLVAMGLVLACMASTASAASINIDINGKSGEAQTPVTYSGAAAIGAAGDVWNGYLVDSSLGERVVSPAQSDFLVDSAGAATTVKFQIGAVCSDAPGATASDLANDLAYVRSPIVTDTVPPTSTTFTLQGLDANGLYDVYLYAGAPVGDYSSSFTIGSTTKSSVRNNVFTGTWIENTNYVKIRATAGADGSLQGIFAGDVTNPGQSGYAVWNGLQVTTAVPEPSSIMLIVTGLFGLLCYAWRKR